MTNKEYADINSYTMALDKANAFLDMAIREAEREPNSQHAIWLFERALYWEKIANKYYPKSN
jgi:hypothetical protein